MHQHSIGTQARAIVLHAAPEKYEPGQMHCWIEEDNKGEAQILGIRLLTQEHRRTGKLAPLLVTYMKEGSISTRGFAWDGNSSALQRMTGTNEVSCRV